MNKETVHTNLIEEALRYISNAKQILREKAGKKNDYYTDPKFVKMASHTVYTGVLLALKHKAQKSNYPPPKDGRWDYYYFTDFLSKRNKTIMKEFNEVYQIMHMYGGYDGGLKYKTIQSGIASAIKVINWCKE